MYLEEARAFTNGIEFYDKSIVFSAQRVDGKVIVTKSGHSQLKSNKSNYRLLIIMLAVFFSLLFQYCKVDLTFKVKLMLLFGGAWVLTTSYYFLSSRSKKNIQQLKYHAAEHKVLNYLDEYCVAPTSWEELEKVSSVSIRCGTTILTFTLTLITLGCLGVFFIPWVFVRLLWVLLTSLLSMYLWAKGKLNFFQKLVLSPPSQSELEVAFFGMKEYLDAKR